MNKPNRFIETSAFFSIVVLLGNLIAWAIPGNVAKLVAREQHVMLGRYSRAHFCWLVVAGLLSMIAIYIRTAPTPLSMKRRVFGLIASALALFPALVIVDLGLRLRTSYPYQPGDHVYHRPPHARYELTYEDVPEQRRSFPNTPPGYGRVACVMTYDAEGFRNAVDRSQCDIVTLGDSFTEGSRVTDSEPWPVRLEELTGLAVCNLGISGYGPPEYIAALEHFGLPKRPKLVICMLYEGNDFRSLRVEAKSGVTYRQVIATSPLVVAANHFLVQYIGAMGAGRDVPALDSLRWLPLSVPDGEGGRAYAFAAKQLTDLYVTREKFELDESWYVITTLLRQMKRACDDAGAELVVAYAPLKAHVVLPLAADRLSGKDVRRFMQYKNRKLKGPEGDAFLPSLLEHLDHRESVVREWCERRSIRFVSLTEPLRRDAAAGRQVFYTYDQHWSPPGHECAARTIAKALPISLMRSSSDSVAEKQSEKESKHLAETERKEE